MMTRGVTEIDAKGQRHRQRQGPNLVGPTARPHNATKQQASADPEPCMSTGSPRIWAKRVRVTGCGTCSQSLWHDADPYRRREHGSWRSGSFCRGGALREFCCVKSQLCPVV